MSRATIDGWARLTDGERLARAVDIAREAIEGSIAHLDAAERQRIFEDFRAMTPAQRDQMIGDVLKSQGVTDAVIEDVTRISREKAGTPRSTW